MSAQLKKNLTIIATLAAFFMAILDSTIVNIVLPDMMKSTGATIALISWIMNGYNMSFAVCLLTASRLADQFGRKKVFMIGAILFSLASLMCGLTSDVHFLIFYRVIQGIGASIVVPVSIPIALTLFSKDQQGTLVGVWGAVSALASASGPVIGGLLTKYYNWHYVFYINVPIGLLIAALAAFAIQESYDETAGKKIDWPGIVFLSIFICALTFFLIKGNDQGWTSIPIISCLVLSAISLFLFVIVERNVQEPIMPLAFFKDIYFSCGNVTLLIIASAAGSILFLNSFYLTDLMGYSVLQSGFILSSFAIGTMISAAFSGPIAGKYGSRWLVLSGIVIVGLSGYLMGDFNAQSSKVEILSVLFLGGAGFGICFAPVMSAVISRVPKNKFGVASGISNMGRTLGFVIGVAVVTAILTQSFQTNVDRVKKSAIGDIQKNKVLLNSVKKPLINKIKKISGSKMGQSSWRSGSRKLRKKVIQKISGFEERMIAEADRQIEAQENNQTTEAVLKIKQDEKKQLSLVSSPGAQSVIRIKTENKEKQVRQMIREKGQSKKELTAKEIRDKGRLQKNGALHVISKLQKDLTNEVAKAFSKTYRSIVIMTMIAFVFGIFSDSSRRKTPVMR